jgi:hypothetical protein
MVAWGIAPGLRPDHQRALKARFSTSVCSQSHLPRFATEVATDRGQIGVHARPDL